MVDWKQKLSSRKFWAAIIGVAVSVMVLFGAAEPAVERVTGLLAALGTLAAYIFAEAYVDGKRAGSGAVDEE